MTTIASGSRVFVGGVINDYGTIVQPFEKVGDTIIGWVVELHDGCRVAAAEGLLIDCTQVAALCPGQLAPGGRA